MGDELDAVQPHMFTDADFAGCVETQRATSGVHIAIRGPNTNYPIAGFSKRQGCVSHSTPEAEIVAHSFGLRQHGLPSLNLWHVLLPHKPALLGHEYNQAMMRVIETGKNPSMRYIGRTHGTSVAWLHECHLGKNVKLAYDKSDKMAADIHTKAFTDAAKWEHAQQLINIFDPKVLKNMNATFIEKLTPVMDFELVTKVSSKAGKKTALVAKWGDRHRRVTETGETCEG